MVAPSVLHANTLAFTEAQDRDTEWNVYGLTSGLNPMQYHKEKEAKTLKDMAEHIRNALSNIKKKSTTDMDEFLKSFAPRRTCFLFV